MRIISEPNPVDGPCVNRSGKGAFLTRIASAVRSSIRILLYTVLSPACCRLIGDSTNQARVTFSPASGEK